MNNIPDFSAEARKRQEEQAKFYQNQRDPFKYGQDVARRRYSEIMSGLQNQKRAVGQTYSDMYQAAKEASVAQRAAGSPSLSGGMAAQYSDLVSARDIKDIGTIGKARDESVRQLDLQGQSAMANAELEGMQATQTQMQMQQNQLSIIQQRNQLIADKTLTNEQKAEQLEVLGYAEQAAELRNQPETVNTGAFAGIAAIAGGSFIVGKAWVVPALTKLGIIGAKGAGAMGALKFLGAVTFKVALPALAVAAAIYGLEKLIDPEGKNQTGLEDSIDKFLGIKYNNQ